MGLGTGVDESPCKQSRCPMRAVKTDEGDIVRAIKPASMSNESFLCCVLSLVTSTSLEGSVFEAGLNSLLIAEEVSHTDARSV